MKIAEKINFNLLIVLGIIIFGYLILPKFGCGDIEVGEQVEGTNVKKEIVHDTVKVKTDSTVIKYRDRLVPYRVEVKGPTDTLLVGIPIDSKDSCSEYVIDKVLKRKDGGYLVLGLKNNCRTRTTEIFRFELTPVDTMLAVTDTNIIKISKDSTTINNSSVTDSTITKTFIPLFTLSPHLDYAIFGGANKTAVGGFELSTDQIFKYFTTFIDANIQYPINKPFILQDDWQIKVGIKKNFNFFIK